MRSCKRVLQEREREKMSLCSKEERKVVSGTPRGPL